MREIKFRGKKVDNGKWVYGAYMKHIRRTPCPIGDSLNESDYQYLILESGFSDWNMPKPIDFHVINPETVGQYTGFKDKDGNEIYEGDILKWSSVDTDGTPIHQHDEVLFKNGSFVTRNTERYSEQYELLSEYLSDCNDIIEVVGNIHESEDEE